MSHGLGRLFAPDERDRLFRAAEVIPDEPTRNFRYWWAGGARLDQGASGTCVGHAWAHYIEDGPITHPGTIDPFALYDDATRHDEWEGNEGDRSSGTSVRAGAKVLISRGLVAEYRWAETVDEVALTLLEKSPVVAGTDWHHEMFTPDRDGCIHPDGNVVGGHAYLLNGVSLRGRKFRVKNSWGTAWGRNGHAWISFDDFGELLRARGEACLAIERRAS